MFKFDLGQKVKIGISKNYVIVTARAEYIDRPNQYLCKHYGESGLPSYDWFDESDISL
ncbi:hypothetical protein [Acinetobacter sp. YH12218]|uniref:hypothetical protein n=1 Tax=Acinetobacter sp. YH12218 TaxID=2601152 RepID=UPI0015D2B551|nr:hypothetical protein [Acinetobacter sp. YH12218]